MDKRTDGRNYTNFKRNLAMMVIYLPVKFELDKPFSSWSPETKNVDGQMDGQTDKTMDK